MFKEIINLWREDMFLKEVIKDFENMLKEAKSIFEKASTTFWSKTPPQETHVQIYAQDKKINEEEQKIRRRLIEHLTINPRKDFPACLVFMSVIKDAERIGDYGKNIFELKYILKSTEKDQFTSIFKELETEISKNLSQISETFLEADTTKAIGIMQVHGRIGKECEALIRSLIETKLPSDKLVCYTLLLRYYKRVSAHTANIASAIVNPIEKIDFVAEGIL